RRRERGCEGGHPAWRFSEGRRSHSRGRRPRHRDGVRATATLPSLSCLLRRFRIPAQEAWMTRSWVSAAVITVLLGSDVPAFAQLDSSRSVGPLTRAAMREATRLAPTDPYRAAVDASWRAVQRLDGGVLLSVTLADGSQLDGYFILAEIDSIY